MPFKTGKLDPAARAAAKEASRAEDERQLDAGEITPEELRRRNSFFYAIDFKKFVMVAIGGKPIKRKPPTDLR